MTHFWCFYDLVIIKITNLTQEAQQLFFCTFIFFSTYNVLLIGNNTDTRNFSLFLFIYLLFSCTAKRGRACFHWQSLSIVLSARSFSTNHLHLRIYRTFWRIKWRNKRPRRRGEKDFWRALIKQKWSWSIERIIFAIFERRQSEKRERNANERKKTLLKEMTG